MRGLIALLGALVLVLAACGKYGPPLRTRPVSPAAPATAASLPGELADDDEEREKSP